ncbi:helix-turn-helix domain-containing protein [Chryseobacterium sp. MEBOG06]|uniref:AraC family transcriptional regulator n=1 Tax=Chryseobacterium sp. MEBOG06 TaxID=2879938 RepID=UPI001F287632|nr:helix-turn-helix domain-containing protein [Chryseobacterium sp. MEBOG06]UKB82621.1 helix-turn-helix domain-containing protein [Chryseobacterium sp. MEBOG06]
MKKTIPSHHNQLENSAVRLMALSVLHEKQTEIHRDDHYMFILQKKGDFVLEVDFKTIRLKGPSVCFVAPGQIHQYIDQKDNDGWFLFVEAAAVSESYREFMDMHQWFHQSVSIDESDLIFDLPVLIEKTEKDATLHHLSIERSLADAAVGIIISRISETSLSVFQHSGQKYSITRQFKKLIADHFRNTKQVQQYAKLLHITPLYLNEAVKDVTGYPASTWIQQKIVWEARRLLVYTTMDVKQIAFELGYDDHVYFSRFFKKETGITALQFRSENHDLSHHHH